MPRSVRIAPAAQLEQAIITLRFEALLLKRYADECHLIGSEPEPCRDLLVSQPRCCAFALFPRNLTAEPGRRGGLER